MFGRCVVGYTQKKKYIKKSLRTKDLDSKTKGRELYYTMMGKVSAGQKLFTITAKELVEKYLDYQLDRVDGGFPLPKADGQLLEPN